MTEARQVLIVGASTSIGEAVVSRFVSEGDRVYATTCSHPLSAALAEQVTTVTLDLASAASLDALASKVATQWEVLDVVVFLSGVLPGKSLSAYDDELMERVMAINFTGQAALLRRLQPFMRDGARVLFMSSVSGERGSFDPIYAASKAALIAMVKSLATWLAPSMRVNAIAPALIEGSTMYKAMAPDRQKYHLAQTPTKQLTTKEDLAEIIVNLCGPAWANLNGQVIRINGGAHV